MDNLSHDIQELRRVLADLSSRVYRIESTLRISEATSEKPQDMRPPEKADIQTSQASPPASPTHQIPPPQFPSVSAETNWPNAPSSRDELESRIGAHWLNRIGISAVLVGVSYALKYAFDNNWIGPAGRITIGLLAGIAIVVWSERFRTKGYKAFSYSLKAVGIGTLYLSLWAGFQLYSLFPSGAAFGAMLLVTAATALLAVQEDAEILAAFALAGGFTTPVLLSTGQNHELALFAYVGLLDFAVLALVFFKPWRRLLTMSYISTLILYGGWYGRYYNHSEQTATAVFATLFFLIFAIAPLAAQFPEHEAVIFRIVPFVLALVNGAVYFFQIYEMVEYPNQATTAWVALGLAAFYIILSRQASLQPKDSMLVEKLRFVHLAIAVGFITIAIPIRLDAHWITIGWLIEAAVLLWVADRIQSSLLNVFAFGALILGVIRLLVLDNFYSNQLMFNARMGTYMLAVAVLGGVAWSASKRSDETSRNIATIATVAFNVLALLALGHEVKDYYARKVSGMFTPQGRWVHENWADYRSVTLARDFTYSALWMLYGAALMVIGFWRRVALVRWMALILIAITIGKVFIYDTSQLDHIYRILSFIVLGILLLAVSFAYQRDWLQLNKQP